MAGGGEGVGGLAGVSWASAVLSKEPTALAALALADDCSADEGDVRATCGAPARVRPTRAALRAMTAQRASRRPRARVAIMEAVAGRVARAARRSAVRGTAESDRSPRLDCTPPRLSQVKARRSTRILVACCSCGSRRCMYRRTACFGRGCSIGSTGERSAQQWAAAGWAADLWVWSELVCWSVVACSSRSASAFVSPWGLGTQAARTPASATVSAPRYHLASVCRRLRLEVAGRSVDGQPTA